MDTKLKKRRPGITFGFFFVAVTILLVAALIVGTLWFNGAVRPDYKDTVSYQSTVENILQELVQLGLGQAGGGRLEWEGSNISYLVEAAEGGVWGANNSALSTQELYEQLSKGYDRGQYDHIFLFQDGVLQEQERLAYGEVSSRYDLANEYPPYRGLEELAGDNAHNSQISFALGIQSVENLRNMGGIYSAYYTWYQMAIWILFLGGLAALALLILLVTLVKHRSLGMAHQAIARGINHLWMEIKLPTLALAVVGFCWTVLEVITLEVPIAVGTAMVVGCFWWCWLVGTDLVVYGKAFFTRNILTSVQKLLRTLESGYPFLARMKRRLLLFLVTEVVIVALLALCALGVLFGIGLFAELAMVLLFIMVILAAVGVGLLVLYIRQYNQNLDNFALVNDYAQAIRQGTAQEPLRLEGDFAPLADNLNCIHSGISRAVEERVRSEQMKVELITNVSHDLKTPLTSIMNYVDLLGRENLQPDYCNDYVKVLEQKSNRLKNMVQDLFEISKANSGNIDLNLEQLDVVALIEQTLAEMGEKSGQANVEIKTQFAVNHLGVYADGRKLHRVFENLLGNALKYAMSGTRIYLSVEQEAEMAVISFKNVSSYEMNFTAQEIVERFQRGDPARATEGSGLGLAIAKSFVELCGGSLTIELDGDLFKAIVRVPLGKTFRVTSAQPEEPAQEEASDQAPTLETDPLCQQEDPAEDHSAIN